MEFLLPHLTEDDEELVIFDLILNEKDRKYHYLKKREFVFRLNDLDESFCYVHFRFYKEDIRRLKRVFQIPDEIILKNRINVSGEEALCILLRRLAYPNRFVRKRLTQFHFKNCLKRLADLMQFFPRGISALSLIFNAMVEHILSVKGDVLENVNPVWMSPENIRILCRSLRLKGSPYPRCFGFLDGTVRSNCRPVYNQRQVTLGKYSLPFLHKIIFTLSFTTVTKEFMP